MSDLVSTSCPFPKERRSGKAGILITVLGLAAMFAIAWPTIKTGVFDAMSTDDAMRLVGVRDLINGQRWFDLWQSRLDPPGVLMHWSRVVDLPLTVSILLLKPVIGAHYVIDIVGGAVVAAGSVLLAKHLFQVLASKSIPGAEGSLSTGTALQDGSSR